MQQSQRQASQVRTGLDVVLRDGIGLPGEGRAGLLCNSAATDRLLRATPQALAQVRGLRLIRIFSPQHGFAGEKQDNMVESPDATHEPTSLPIVSLYGRVRRPEPAMLDDLDAVIVDLPDVGTRVYTFLTTALYMLRACAEAGVAVIVLDRPNPIGGDAVEGPMLEAGFTSFVGEIPIPLRHGLTPGEFLRLGARALDLEPALDLTVIPVEGWRRDLWFDETGLTWVMPSPNLPTLESTVVYPGQVLLEGTTLSEGRGTTRPFELWGAPWLDTRAVANAIGPLEGCLLREVAFEPTFQKHAGQLVRGFQIHVTDRDRYRPVRTTVALLAAVRSIHPERKLWREPPYEYETKRMPIDLISGSDRLRAAIDAGASVDHNPRPLEQQVAAVPDRRQGLLQ
ncbi:MAG: DUF1343 domain-containing protein [Candidatus Eisenbacteria bacterium]|nr:DUF1343 domain-containing protein [Candidatus Eisenbacteria bacterium]